MPIKGRSEKPPKFNDYTKYKPYLRREFNHECVFCASREPEIGGTRNFHVDHYKPQSRFRDLENVYSNLLYSCGGCNCYKGNYWPDAFQRILRNVILNPFLHKFEKHLNMSEPTWIGLTKCGRWNVDKLRLSSPIQVIRREDRQNISRTISLLEKQIEVLEQGLALAQKTKDANAESSFQLTINDLTSQVDSLKRKISGPMD